MDDDMIGHDLSNHRLFFHPLYDQSQMRTSHCGGLHKPSDARDLHTYRVEWTRQDEMPLRDEFT
jgi:hypothetical protein